MKLAIGTVQFGRPYGIGNKTGRIARDEVADILRNAKSAGIDMLDTAAAYGASETVLGQVGVSDWKIVTKLQPVPEDCEDVLAWIRWQILNSLATMNLASVYGLLLHAPSQLLHSMGQRIWEALIAARNEGLVERVGISIYDPEELDHLFERFRPEIVQAPFNILDRRLVHSGWLRKLSDAGVEIHVRSVFLQGLLLMNDANRPPAFSRWNNLWTVWKRWLGETGLRPLEACLGFISAEGSIDRAVVGIDGLSHLREILDTDTRGSLFPPDTLDCSDLDLINPSRWK